MKTLRIFLPVFVILFYSVHAQPITPDITIKVSEKSGFLGIGKPKFIKISLSTRNRDKELTSDLVNAGDTYYFVMKDSGGWKFDDDFLKDELPKLTINQEAKSLHVEAFGAPIAEGERSVLIVGCKKTLQIYKPFTFSFPVGKTTSTIEMIVPLEYWPGYTKMTKLSAAVTQHISSGNFTDAISSCNEILKDNSLEIFPLYGTIKPKRLDAFQRLLNDYNDKFTGAMAATDRDPKQKIASTEEYLAKFSFIADNVAKAELQVQQSDSGIAGVLSEAKNAITRVQTTRDSLRQALSEQNIRWIMMGSSGGKIDFRYKYMIETLAFAFTSVNFNDTAAQSLKVYIPEELSARLQKYNLSESYETFLRVIIERWKKKEPMFPAEFLHNLQKDSLQFPLPYYSMLKGIHDFYNRDYASAKAEIILVMRRCYTYELTERLDQLRILIHIIEKNIPADVLKNMKDGYAAEERGDNEKAIEYYKDAMLIAEDYAPGAFALGKLYDRTGDSYKANNFFQKAVTSDTLFYSAYRFLYINYFKNANFKPMIDLLAQAITRGNDFYDIHYYLGIAYNGAALYDLAIQQYERALELNSKSIDANIQAGISYQNMKSYAKARDYFNRAITIDPENQTATENLKRLDELQKKF
jgi:tetratricopeptide (TPR) repeat protein